MSKNGIVFIAFGERYVEEAIYSATHLKKHCDLPTTIFTDQPVSSACFERVMQIEPAHKRAKVDYMSQSPYERTLYLDSDTKVVADISDIFSLLDRFDMAAVQDHCRKGSRWSKVFPRYNDIPYAFPEFNSGVVLFRKTAVTDAFFETWRRYFYEYQSVTDGQDQASFRVALWQSEVTLHSLPTEYNVRNAQIMRKLAKRTRNAADAELLKPRIFHWHGLDRPPVLAAFRSKFRPMRYF